MSNVGDIEDMAKNTVELLTNEAKFSQFKTAAFEQAKNFDIDTVLPMYEQLYREVIATGI
jgi:glycosyltransferase involved in cell wall biosynthesis